MGRKRRIGYTLIAAVITVAVLLYLTLLESQTDAVDKTVLDASSTPQSVTDEVQPGDFDLYAGPHDIEAGPDGILAYVTGDFGLYRGSYILQIDYTADAAGTADLVSERLADDQNQMPKVYASAALPAGGGIATIPLTLSSDRADLALRITGPGIRIISVTALSSGPVFADNVVYAVLVGIAFLFLLYMIWFGYKRPLFRRRNTYITIALVLLLTVITSLPDLGSGLFKGQDIFYHLNRIMGMADALRAGSFPVRIQTDLAGVFNYGYGSSFYYPDLFLYIPAGLKAMGMSLFGAYRLFLVLMNFGAAAISYYSFSRLFRSTYGGWAGCIFFTTALYRLNCVFVREATGEALAITFLPLILWGLYEVLAGNQKRWPALVLGFTGVFESHIDTTMLAGIFTIVVVLVFIRRLFTKERRVLSLVKAAGVTLLLNLWFIVPLCNMMRYPTGQSTDFRIVSAISPFLQLFSLHFPVVGGQVPNADMPLTIGGGLVLVMLLFLAGELFYRIPGGWKRPALGSPEGREWHVGRVCLVTGLFALFLCTDLIPWYTLETYVPFIGTIMTTVQFMFRLLSIVTVCFSAVGVVIVLALRRRYRKAGKLILGVTLAICLVCASVLLEGIVYHSGTAITKTSLPDSSSASVFGITRQIDGVTTGQFSLVGTDLAAASETGDRLSPSDDATQITDFTHVGSEVRFTYTLPQGVTGAYVDVPITYFPGYVVVSGGKTVAATPGPGGIIRVSLSDGTGQVQVYYRESSLYLVADFVTLITAAFWIGWRVWKHKRKRGQKQEHHKSAVPAAY